MRNVGSRFARSGAALAFAAGLVLACQPDIVAPSSDGPAFAKGGSPVLYSVTMSHVGSMGLLTDCTPPGTGAVEAKLTDERPGAARLQVGGGASGYNFLLNLVNTGVQWTRQYDAGRGLSGVFDGCYGSTAYHPGTLFIDFGTKKGRTHVHFTWHFDYYDPNGVREHFTMGSADIPFPPWNGAGVSGRVAGSFDLMYYHGAEGIRYVPFPGGEGLGFEFDLSVTRVQ